MGGHVLIVDSDPSRRAGLGADLGATGLGVADCPDPARLPPAVAARRPDLVVLDIGDDPRPALAALAQVRARPGRPLPVLALVPPGRGDLRLAALRAGADDAADRGAPPRLLQARVRSLLRAAEADSFEDRGDGDLLPPGLPGLSEPGAAFAGAAPARPAAPARVAVLPVFGAGSALVGLGCLLAPRATLVRLEPGQVAGPRPDLVILDGGPLRGDLAEGARVLAQLADLRGRPATRDAATLVLLPVSAIETAALALDLGAGDVVAGPVAPEELAFRAQMLLLRRAAAERLRAQVLSRLRAADTDPLTGIANLRQADSVLRRMFEGAWAGGRGLAVLMIDIDHFKSINDRLGHSAGNRVLTQVARRLQAGLRADDLLARVGGEEFRVALPGAPLAPARRVAEGLRAAIAAQPFRVDDRRGATPLATGAEAFAGPLSVNPPSLGPARDDSPALIRVTISIGVAAATAGDLAAGLRPSDLLERADAALYAAKAAGRNRVELAAPA